MSLGLRSPISSLSLTVWNMAPNEGLRGRTQLNASRKFAEAYNLDRLVVGIQYNGVVTPR